MSTSAPRSTQTSRPARSSRSPSATQAAPAARLARLKAALPFVLGGVALAAIILLAYCFGGVISKHTLVNNINDGAINWSAYDSQTLTLSDSLKITRAGTYILSGTIADGLIEVNTAGAVKLILNGVTVSNSAGPTLLVSEAETVVIETAAGSQNYFADGRTYTVADADLCAAIFSKDDLVLQGAGELNVIGNYEDGIVSKDNLKLNSGTVFITAKDDGLRGRDSVYITGGKLTITAGGDALKTSNPNAVAKGYMRIDGGQLNLSAGRNGLHADASLEINGGAITVTASHEGLEGARITINGGELNIVASDDGLNAAGGHDSSSVHTLNYKHASSADYYITINGGTVWIDAQGDGIDANGAINFYGGTVIIDGPTDHANGALDADSGINYHGGNLLALGTSGRALAPNPDTSTAYATSLSFDQTYPASTVVSVQNSAGQILLEHRSAKTFNHLVLAATTFRAGETYYVLLGDAQFAIIFPY